MVLTLFSCNYNGDCIELYGSFNMWKHGIIMNNNVCEIDIPIGTYEYKFKVDGIWKHDSLQPTKTDGFGGKNNLLRVKGDNDIIIIHISDTCGNHRQFLNSMFDADILIVSGNFTKNGEYHEYLDFNNWLGELNVLYKIITLGNNELKLYNTGDDLVQIYKRLSNAIVLSNRSIKLYDLRILGMDMHNYDINNLNNNLLPIDILISHDPPYSILDSFNNINSGSKILLDSVSVLKPRVHMFGQNNECYGSNMKTWDNGGVTFFSNGCNTNAEANAIINKVVRYKIQNKNKS